MEKRFLGKTGLEVSALGFGGWEIGSSDRPDDEIGALLNAALDSGIDLIDTAAAYLRSEELIGKYVSGRRNEFVLATKCGALDGFTREDWSKKGVIETIERSLRLLRTDHVDIVQLHSCSAEILRQADCIEGLIRAQERGMCRFVGYSGDNDDAACALSQDFFDTLQTSVSIADQSAIDTNIKKANESGLGVIAKRPVANALWRFDQRPADAYFHEYWDRLRKLDFGFLTRTVEESVATALRFTLSVEGVSAAIIGTSDPIHLRANVSNMREPQLAGPEFEAIRARWLDIAAADWTGMT